MFHSPLAYLVLAVLLVLALPAVWMLCEVALDLPPLGLALAGSCGVAVYVLAPRAGVTLVDATLALMALTAGVLTLTSLAGATRWLWRAPVRPCDVPPARLVR